MKSIFSLLLFLISCVCLSEEYPACNVHIDRESTILVNEKIVNLAVSIESKKNCENPKLEIKFYIPSSNRVVYHYKALIEPILLENWKNVTLEYAQNYVEGFFSEGSFIKCSNILPSDLGNESAYDYNVLFVSKRAYEKYRANTSNCIVFIHQVGYETSRYVVFHKGENKGVTLSEFGI